ASGAVAGLVAIPPACGYVQPWAALVLGAIAGGACYFGLFIKGKLGEARGKYGKYVGYKEEVPLPAAEAKTPEETGMESEKEDSPEGEDSISKIQRELFSVGGKKHSLSSKKTK
ncbi:MAG: hypothetical protein WCK00_14985, partial [Deltaproteobacteria bacterium]